MRVNFNREVSSSNLNGILRTHKLQHPLGSGGNNVVVAAVVLETSGFDFLCVLYVLRHVGLDWVWCVRNLQEVRWAGDFWIKLNPATPYENDIFGFVCRSLAGGKCA